MCTCAESVPCVICGSRELVEEYQTTFICDSCLRKAGAI